MKLYHATFKAYFESIQEKGLIPHFHEVWSISKNNCLYLCESWSGASDFCEASCKVDSSTYESGILVFEVDTDNLDENLIKLDENWSRTQDFECYEYYGCILYKFLELYMETATY